MSKITSPRVYKTRLICHWHYPACHQPQLAMVNTIVTQFGADTGTAPVHVPPHIGVITPAFREVDKWVHNLEIGLDEISFKVLDRLRLLSSHNVFTSTRDLKFEANPLRLALLTFHFWYGDVKMLGSGSVAEILIPPSLFLVLPPSCSPRRAVHLPRTIYAPAPPCPSSTHAPSMPQVSCSERNTRVIQPRQRFLQHSGTLAKHKAAVRRVTAGLWLVEWVAEQRPRFTFRDQYRLGIGGKYCDGMRMCCLAAGRNQEVADVARCSNYVK
ncbi:hypothetical protein C8R45DRAFT_1074070 [Mycena sanguinolenta]|nr:hypothetical protein C8R45DRAFT_1074070 [Mycena sanguinolenta]